MFTYMKWSHTLPLLATLLFQFGIASSAYCQAWTAPKGTGAFSISYLNEFSGKSYFGNGDTFRINPLTGVKENNSGDVRTHAVYFDFGYSITDKLAVSASIPYMAKRFDPPRGQDPFTQYGGIHFYPDGTVPLDDGKFHGSFQDIGVRVRYNVTASPFMLTPYLEFNTPSNDYLFFSHATVGNHVRSLGIGAYMGGSIDRILPNAYIQTRFGYTFDEKILDYSRNRSLGDVEFGYFISPPLRVFTIFAGEVTHGGLQLPLDPLIYGPSIAATNPEFFHHAQISSVKYLNFGVGGQYSINERVDFYGVFSRMITGRNLHDLTYGFTFGFSWGFGGNPQRPCHC